MLFKTATSRNIFSIVAVGVVATVTTASTLFYMSYQQTKDASIAEMKAAASLTASQIEQQVSTAMQTVYTIRNAMQAMASDRNGDRAIADGILAEIQRNSSGLLGVWTGWEANTFDGRDAEFASTPRHDATGRYIPYATSTADGGINFDPLLDYQDPEAGAYYQTALKAGKTIILEPFAYEVNGVSTLMTSLTTPITIGGKVVGVAGADVGLAEMAALMATMKPMETGFVALLASDGSFVSHPNSEFLGRPLTETIQDAWSWQAMIVTPGNAVSYAGPDGASHLGISVPVNLPGGTVWSMIVSVPETTVYGKLTSMAWTSIAVIAGAALLLVLLGVVISSRFRRRLEGMIEATGNIAAGRMDVEITGAESRDEFGAMARSLVVLRDAAIAKDRLEREAEDNRSLSEQERIARERQKAREAADIRFAVEALADGLGRLAEGNVVHRITQPFAGDLDSLRVDFNASLEKLQTALRAVGENARSIDAGAEEIRTAADDLSRRTEQQAASVEETAAALEEITATVKSSTERAEHASALVNKTKSGAEQSGTIVRGAVAAMLDIEQSSRDISNIIGVIDDIAFQTGLLALNAGVEAARAGEAGRGFAVVAHEVRELAQRSATAAKEIKELITNSGEKVRSGVNLVQQTGQSLELIVTQVQEIDHHVAAIVTAAREQSTGMQEISTAVTAIDRGTQQNAAMVEESTAASHGLAREAGTLNRLIGQFTLGNDTVTPIRRAPPPSAEPARASPVHALGQKIAGAFGATALAIKPEPSEWEEF